MIQKQELAAVTKLDLPNPHPHHSVIKVIIRSRRLLLPVLGGIQLVDPRPVVGRVPSESDVKMLPNNTQTRNQRINTNIGSSSPRRRENQQARNDKLANSPATYSWKSTWVLFRQLTDKN